MTMIHFLRLFLCRFYIKDKIDWEKFSRDRSEFSFIYPSVDEEQAYFDLSRAFNVLNRSVHAQKGWNSNSKLALLNELIGKRELFVFQLKLWIKFCLF